jgi:hypothetical protein
MNPLNPVEILMQNLAEQNRCYDALLQDMEKQLQAIHGNDDEFLMQTIKDKNVKIQTLHRLEQEARDGTAKLTPQQQIALGEQSGPLRESMMKALEHLIQREEECQEAITAKRAELQEQLVSFKKKKTLFKGFEDTSRKSGGFSSDA